jgi:hypothetical protein
MDCPNIAKEQQLFCRNVEVCKFMWKFSGKPQDFCLLSEPLLLARDTIGLVDRLTDTTSWECAAGKDAVFHVAGAHL